MFPASFTPYIDVAIARNVSPCWIDIVGNNSFPALWYDISATEVAFRMTLNGDPRMPNNDFDLKAFVWGVKIVDASNNVLFTVRVNGNVTGNNDAIEILNSNNDIIYTNLNPFDNPTHLNPNLRILSAGANFGCTKSLDEDFFMDFVVPKSAFILFSPPNTPFDFTSIFRFCFFTSTQVNVINGEQDLCGNLINVPPETPNLSVSKEIISGPAKVFVNEVAMWLLRITVSNISTVTVNDVVVTDTINSALASGVGTLVPSPGTSAVYVTPIITWTIGNMAPNAVATLNIPVTGSFLAPGHQILNEGTVTASNIPNPINFQDQGIDVIALTPPVRGIKIADLIIDSLNFTK